MASAIDRVAIITGGTRGIGAGICEKLAASGDYQCFVLTYNTNKDAADSFAQEVKGKYNDNNIKIEVVGGDISLEETRDEIFIVLDTKFSDCHLAAVIHNAGQYVGVTSDNVEGLGPAFHLQFGDGSMISEDGKTKFDAMRYYHRMYGEAYIDLCERGLVRMKKAAEACKESGKIFRGSLVGISSPGCNTMQPPNAGYSMPGAGKSLMEYASRIIAINAASIGVNSNIVIPGPVKTEAWERTEKHVGAPPGSMLQGIVKSVPMKEAIMPSDIGDFVSFLCDSKGGGHFITGQSMLIDAGLAANRKFR